ncbi:MAG: hypothetical protein Q8L95_09895 [Burkholderiales bacterium]|nr:hypothetical protein [Burkholderiales bacterium]
MTKQKKAAQGSAAAATDGTFSKMSLFGKISFIGKACVFFLSLGFAFPNIFSD